MNLRDRIDSEGYQSIFENAMEGIFQSSIEGRYLKVNPAMARIFGYDSPEDMVSGVSDIAQEIHVDANTRNQFIQELTNHDQVVGFEARNYRKDGSIIWTRTNARTIRDEAGNLLYFEGFLTDITSYKEAEIALKESEEKYRVLVEHLPGAVFLNAIDDPDEIFYISSKIKEILGYSPEEWISKIHWSDHIHPEDRERVLRESQRTDETGELFLQEYRIRKRDGNYSWIREESSLIKRENGEPLFWQGFFLDISSQKQAENAILQSEEQFKKIFQANPIASLIATLEEGRFVAANNAYWSLTGYTPDEFLGHTSTELGFVTKRKRKKLVTRLKKEKTIRNERGKLIIKSGKTCDSLEFYELIYFNGQDCILAMFYDMTEQVQAQAVLQESEEKYRQLFEAESDAIFLIENKSGIILEVNDAATALYGYSKEELLKMKNSDLSAEVEETRKITRTTPVNKDQVISVPLRFHRKKDGTVFPVEITGRFFEWHGRAVHIAAIRDITERKKAEEALRASDERFRLSFQTSPDSININRLEDGLYIDVNEGFTAITGYQREEVIGKTSLEINIWENPEERAKLVDELKENGHVNNLEAKFRMKDGRTVTGLMSARIIILEGVPHIISITRDIETIKQTEATLQRQLEELSILHNTAVAASSSKSLDELIKQATDIIYGSLHPDNCGIGLVTNRGDSYRAHWSYRGADIKGMHDVLPLSKGITGKVILTGKPVRLSNVSQDPDYIEVTKGVRSELCVPINIQDRIIGSINIESKRANAFNESDERLLSTIAGTLATAIGQLRLFETSKQQLEKLTILNKVSLASTEATSVDDLIEKVTQIIGESLYPDNFGVLLIKENKGTLQPHPSYRGITDGKLPGEIPLENGISGQVASSGKPLRVANVRGHKNYIEVTSQVRSELCVPITNGDRILGVINAESLKINTFTEEDERLLTTIAGTLATAIEKLNLLEAEKKRRHAAEILLEATTKLTTSLNLGTIFDSILEILSSIVYYDSASIAMEQNGTICIVAERGFPPNDEVIGKQLAYSEKWRRMSTSQKAVIIPDVHLDPDFEQWAGSEYIRSWMSVPMGIQGKLIGYINLDSRNPSSYTDQDAVLVQTFANSAAVAIENARLFETEQESREKADALREATAALTSTIELELLLNIILESAEKLVPYDSASIEILNKGFFEVIASRNLKNNKTCVGEKYPYQAGKWGPLETLKQPIILSNVQEDDRFVKLNGTEYIRGWMGVPMIVQNRLFGFLNFDSATENFFTRDHAALAQTFGNQAAIAIENARLFQEESRRTQIIEAMANIANEFATAHELIPALDKITKRALELLHASTVAIYLVQDDNRTVKIVTAQGEYREQLLSHTIQVGRGITGNIIATGKPEIINEIFKDPRRVKVPDTPEYEAQPDTIMSAPLIIRGKTIGAINTWRQRASGLFNETELNFLVNIANQTSMLIESIRLFQETTKQAQEAHAIAEVGRDISSTLQLDIVLERIAQYAKELLRAETSAVYLFNPEEQLLQAIAAIGNEANEIKNDPLPVGIGILGNIAVQKSGEIVNDTQADHRAITIKGTEIDPHEHLMGAPVLSKDQLTGLLAVWRTGDREEFKPSELDFLSSLAQQAAVAIENAGLFEVEQRRRREAEILRQSSAALTSSLEPEEILNTLLDQIATLIPYNSAAVFLLEKDHYKVVVGKGYNHPEKVLGKKLPLDDEFANIVRETRQPFISQDIQADPRFKRFGDADHIHGWMCFPLIVRGQVTGHLTIDSFEMGAYNSSDAELAMAFANQAATALENARQFEAEQRHFQEAEILRQASEAITSTLEIQQVLTSILENLNRVVPFDSAGIFLMEDSNLRLTAVKGLLDWERNIDQLFPTNNSLFQEISQTRLPLILNDAWNDPRYERWVTDQVHGWMGIPLIARGTIIGYITIDSQAVGEYDEHDATLAMTFAHQAAAAIENARLYERGEQQISQLTVLRDIDSAISSSFDLRITLNLLIEYAVRELKADAIAILLYNSDLKSLQPYASTGFSHKHNNQTSSFRIGEGLAGNVVLQRKLIFIADLETSAEYSERQYRQSENFKSYFGVPLIGKGLIKGVMEVYTRQEAHPDANWLNFLHTLAGQAAIAIDNAQMFRNLQRSNQELILAYDTTLAGWGRALELRDKETQGHTDRVVELTLELARRMGLAGEELTNIMRGTLLHDIGKMGIPDDILHKPGPLTEEEWAIMRQHPQYAYDLMNPIPYLRQALDIPYAHHERWDGSGYPRGLKGEEIPLAARIFAAVDIWDALLYDRVYRAAWPEDKVIEYLKSASGIELDPAIVEKFLELIEEKRDENQAE